jgi:Beta-lactamase enzyme family
MGRKRHQILTVVTTVAALTVSVVASMGLESAASAQTAPGWYHVVAASPDQTASASRDQAATLSRADAPAATPTATPTPTPTPTPSPTPTSKPKPKSGICTSATHPGLAAKISSGITAALAGRKDSVVGLTADDPAEGLSCAFHRTWHFYAASAIKVTIISALLRKVGGPAGLTANQRHLCYLMITQSDNDAATALWNDVGMTDMQAFLNAAGMRHTILNYAWGLTEITAQDELTLLRVLVTTRNVLSKRSRQYVLKLMAEVIPSERWGVSAGAPSKVTVHLKNGWLPYPGANDWRVNSIGAFTGKNISYQIVVLTGPVAGGQGEGYGITTIQLAAGVINRILARREGATPSSVAQPGPEALAAPGG